MDPQVLLTLPFLLARGSLGLAILLLRGHRRGRTALDLCFLRWWFTFAIAFARQSRAASLSRRASVHSNVF